MINLWLFILHQNPTAVPAAAVAAAIFNWAFAGGSFVDRLASIAARGHRGASPTARRLDLSSPNIARRENLARVLAEPSFLYIPNHYEYILRLWCSKSRNVRDTVHMRKGTKTQSTACYSPSTILERKVPMADPSAVPWSVLLLFVSALRAAVPVKRNEEYSHKQTTHRPDMSYRFSSTIDWNVEAYCEFSSSLGDSLAGLIARRQASPLRSSEFPS